MHIRPPRLRSHPPLGIRIRSQHIHRGPRFLLTLTPTAPRPLATPPRPLVLHHDIGLRLREGVHSLEREELGGVVDAGGDGGDAGYGEDASENLDTLFFT
jgi:hypothetical protein